MRTSVVIPCYNHYDLLHQILWDLYKNCREDIDEVVVVDDASDDGFQGGLREFWFKKNLLPIKVITNKENLGFLKSSNRGMAYASGDILILLSNDVEVKINFIKDVKTILYNEPKTLIGNRLLVGDTSWNTFNGKTYQYLEGWLLACTKAAWKDLGGFDERFVPNDMEDIDLSTTAIEKGYLLLSLDNPMIKHKGAQTYGYNPAREAITKRNKELFRQKWIK